MRETCNSTCIDLIVTDQPILVLNSGVRDSLDGTVKYKIVFFKLNFHHYPNIRGNFGILTVQEKILLKKLFQCTHGK